VVYEFKGENSCAGVQGETYGCLVNQLTPEKKTVLFTRHYDVGGRGVYCTFAIKKLTGTVGIKNIHKCIILLHSLLIHYYLVTKIQILWHLQFNCAIFCSVNIYFVFK